MKLNEFNNIQKKIIIKWYFWRLFFLLTFLVLLILSVFKVFTDNVYVNCGIITLASLFSIITFIRIVLVRLNYKNYKYQLKDDELVYKRGVIFKTNAYVPYCQLQDCELFQGPIDLILKLVTVTFSTAGGSHEIVGLTTQEAEEIVLFVKDKIKERVAITRKENKVNE